MGKACREPWMFSGNPWICIDETWNGMQRLGPIGCTACVLSQVHLQEKPTLLRNGNSTCCDDSFLDFHPSFKKTGPYQYRKRFEQPH